MAEPLVELRRIAGQFVLLLTAVYAMGLVGIGFGVFEYHTLTLLAYLPYLVPAGAFVPSTIDAIRLQRTEDRSRTKTLWRRSILLALIGTAMWISAAILLHRMAHVTKPSEGIGWLSPLMGQGGTPRSGVPA